jgi:hypothetical protein
MFVRHEDIDTGMVMAIPEMKMRQGKALVDVL